MDIPRTLRERLSEGKVIPFIGAGVSMAVKNKISNEPMFPSWKKLLEAAAARLEDETNKPYADIVRAFLNLPQPQYLEAAKYARDGLKGAIWSKLLKTQIDIPYDQVEEKSLGLAKAVWELGNDLLITTNYDRILRWACPQQYNLKIWDIEAHAEQRNALSNGVEHPTVWHLHGHIDNAINLVLTPDGYNHLYIDDGKAEKSYKAALETLRQLMTTHTFLFIGYSLDDEHLGVQLQGMNEIFKGETGPHYALIRTATVEQTRNTLEKSGLDKFVDIIPFDDFGKPLLELLRQLSDFAKEKDTDLEEITRNAEISIDSQIVRVADFDPRKPVFYVPFRSKGDQVIGRETALSQVREQLTTGRHTAIGQTAAFQGLGGLGKTQLAVEYAYRYKDEYPNGVIWLNADQDIDAQLTDLAEKARWVAPESEHKYKLEIALHRLKTYSDCLLIFDNVESRSDIEKYLPELQANPHILITSRTEQTGFKPISLDLLGKEDSLILLLQEAGRNQSPQNEDEVNAAREITELLEGLPLALELAGAYIRYRQLSWKQYRDLLQQNLKTALTGKFLDSFTKHEKDIYSTLKINEEVFEDEPRLRDILDLLAWSGSAPMGISLMSQLFKVSDQTELISALSLGKALKVLQKSPDIESYAIHRLVREVRQEEIPLQERENWVNETCRLLGDWFQERRNDFNYLSAYEAEIDHMQSWIQHSSKYGMMHTSRLIWLQAYPPYHYGRNQEVKMYLERALQVFNQKELSDLRLKAHLLNDLGVVGERYGEYKKALEYAEQALKIRLELFGENNSDTALSYNNMGSIYGNLGDHKKALEYEEKALKIQLEFFRENNSDTALSYNNIGSTYGNLGDHKKALEHKEKALKIRLEFFGENNPDTASCYINTGTTYGNLGDHKKALEYEEKALKIRLEFFGENNPDTASCYNNIGITYGNLGDHKKALEYKEKGMFYRKELLGESHPDTIASVCSVAYTLLILKQGYKARPLVEEYLRKTPKDNLNYHLLQKCLQKILSDTPGFQARTNVKNKKKKKRR
jgi:tetratricopeptide (TPR) repeat protein